MAKIGLILDFYSEKQYNNRADAACRDSKEHYVSAIVLQQLRRWWLGSCAIRICEPRQVRKEAAISGISYVPQIGLFHRLAELLQGNFVLFGKEVVRLYGLFERTVFG